MLAQLPQSYLKTRVSRINNLTPGTLSISARQRCNRPQPKNPSQLTRIFHAYLASRVRLAND